jgi:uncharacterized protein YhfF
MTDPEPTHLLGLPAFGFAEPGPLRDELTAALLSGAKTSTTSLLAEYQIDGSPMPVVGERWLVYDSEQRPVAIIETASWHLATIGTVDDAFAVDEGEGYRDANDWRDAHVRYWTRLLEEIRRGLGDPAFDLTDDTPVVCERFRLVERLGTASGGVPG